MKYDLKSVPAQPCWTCKHATRHLEDNYFCPWAWDFKPVPGWEIEDGKRYALTEGTHIKFCPKYEWDGTYDTTFAAMYRDNHETEQERAAREGELAEMRREKAQKAWKARHRRDLEDANAAIRDGTHPKIYNGGHRTGKCINCRYCVVTHRDARTASGECLLILSEPVHVYGSSYCILYEDEEHGID